jgi:hypothetical protein
VIARLLKRSVAAMAGAALISVPPFGLTPCEGVRPGATVITAGQNCTLNFLFKGSDGGTYAGTAGHCADDVLETRTWEPGTGPLATIPTGQSDINIITEPHKAVGRWVFKTHEGDWREATDFGLIRIDDEVTLDPEMCHFGGPTGINAETTSEPTQLHHYGNGRGFREGPRARTAIAPFGFPDSWHVFAYGAAAPGDSGSGVIDPSGRAVGVLVAVGTMFDNPPTTDGDVGVLSIQRLPRVLRMAERALGIRLRLMTADLIEA